MNTLVRCTTCVCQPDTLYTPHSHVRLMHHMQAPVVALGTSLHLEHIYISLAV